MIILLAKRAVVGEKLIPRVKKRIFNFAGRVMDKW